MKRFRLTPSVLVISILALSISLLQLSKKNWEKEQGVIYWDVIGYYAYLPATFIFHDIKLEKKETFDHGLFWPEKTPDGKNLIKTTMGLSIMYAPFFGLAHAYCIFTGNNAFGFSAPYKLAVLISSLFYLIIGLFFLRKVLLRYFSETVSTLTILAIVAGTNLIHYVSFEAAMSHGYTFAISCIFIWLAINWHENLNLKYSLWLGLVGGLLVLIRPTNILMLLFPVLYNVSSLTDLKNNFIQIIKKPRIPIILIIGFIIPWIPQFVYWKIVSGHFFFYSYTSNEIFLFNSPKLFEIFFGFRKGWLLYTPIMVFSIIGLFLLKGKLKPFRVPIIVLFILLTYLISCWWCWWFGGSFGLRPMIDMYAFLSIPMAAVFASLFTKSEWIQRIGVVLIIGLIAHNLFQFDQYSHGAIHHSFMTKKSYMLSLGHRRPQPGFYEALEEPDPEPAKLDIQSLLIHKAEAPYLLDSNKIVKYYFDGAENKQSDFLNDSCSFSTEDKFAGNYSLKLDLDHPFGFELRIPKNQLRKQILIRVKKKGDTGRLVICAEKQSEFCVSSADAWPIPDSKWKRQEFLINTPRLDKSNYLRIFCCNPVNHLQYYDEMEIYILD